ncbi:MAG: penicillin-binding protein activator [Gammaproteobacteria bacterium]|nr:penicillin-binding protein activator [Gammaproteobacteria bacterium]
MLTLTGCADLAPFSVAVKPAPQQPLAVTEQKVQALESAGDFQAAAEAWEQLAASAAPPRRDVYRLSAVHDWLRAGETQRARAVLQTLDSKGLDATLWVRRQLLEARIALAESKPQATLAALKDVSAPKQAQPLQAEIHVLRAEAQMQLGHPLNAARERVALEPLLTDAIQRRDNQQAIVRGLAEVPEPALAGLAARRPSDSLSGWAELVRIARAAGQDGAAFTRQIAGWHTRYRKHPASDETIAWLRDIVPRTATTTPPAASAPTAPVKPAENPGADTGSATPIALLLPLSGPLAAAGSAVRDGFMAAANAQTGGPVVRVYDVGAANAGESSVEVLAVYQQARQEGAAFVVGPLDKDGVKALYTLGPLPLPTLALNYNEDSGVLPANLYEFGLAPEDEASQAAERAWLDGHTRALVLTPEGEWGERILRAFRDHLERLGGIVVAHQSYAPEAQDVAGPIRKLLDYRTAEEVAKVARKDARKGTSKDASKDKKEKPTRRQDADFIFLAALPNQARIIHPQLRYYYAFDLPVYATSHLYGAKPDPDPDQDLDGIFFSDMPWVLADDTPQKALSDALLAQKGETFYALRRLYALGVDAYRVIEQLPRLRNSSAERFEGDTGSLRLDEAHRLRRQPIWARFENGVPRLVDTGAGPPR